MKLSPLFMEIWSFGTIQCLNFNRQRQKRHDVTNGVNVNFLIRGFVRCMKKLLFFANIHCVIISMCAMEFAEELTLIYFCLMFARSENDRPYFKNADSC